MNRILGLVMVAAIIIAGCNTGNEDTLVKDKEVIREELLQKIAKVEETLFSTENAAMNYKEANEVIELYREYAKQFPKEKDAAEYLFKAADVSMGLNEYIKAEKILDRIIGNYSDSFDKIVEVHYLKAFIYDVHLNKKAKAQDAYQFIINNYPEHKLADDASAAIKTLTMSDDDLIKMFKEKNGVSD